MAIAINQINYVGILLNTLVKLKINSTDLFKQANEAQSKNGKIFKYEISFLYEDQNITARGIGRDKKSARKSTSKNALIELCKHFQKNLVPIDLQNMGLTQSEIDNSDETDSLDMSQTNSVNNLVANSVTNSVPKPNKMTNKQSNQPPNELLNKSNNQKTNRQINGRLNGMNNSQNSIKKSQQSVHKNSNEPKKSENQNFNLSSRRSVNLSSLSTNWRDDQSNSTPINTNEFNKSTSFTFSNHNNVPQLYAKAPNENGFESRMNSNDFVNRISKRPIIKMDEFKTKKQMNSAKSNESVEDLDEEKTIENDDQHNNDEQLANRNETKCDEKIDEKIDDQTETKYNELNHDEELSNQVMNDSNQQNDETSETDHEDDYETNYHTNQENINGQDLIKDLNDQKMHKSTNPLDFKRLTLNSNYYYKIVEMDLVSGKEEFIKLNKMREEFDIKNNSPSKEIIGNESGLNSKSIDQSSATKRSIDEHSTDESNDEKTSRTTNETTNRVDQFDNPTNPAIQDSIVQTIDNLEVTRNAIDYLEENYPKFEEIFKFHDQNKDVVIYSELIAKLLKSLPELKYHNHSILEYRYMVAFSRIFYQNQCLFTVFDSLNSTDSTFERRARKMFYTLRLQLERRI